MISTILGWLSGGIIKTIGGVVLQGYETYLKGKDSAEAKRVEAIKVAAEIGINEDRVRQAIIVAEQGNWFTRSVRPLLGWIVAIFVGKLLLWDKAFGQWTNGTTDALDTNLWWIVQTIIIAYMGGRSIEKVAEKLAGALRK